MSTTRTKSRKNGRSVVGNRSLVRGASTTGDAFALPARVTVNKAYKMFIGGAFVRSESGRYLQVKGNTASADPEIVNVPRGSRKDVRDAVLAYSEETGH